MTDKIGFIGIGTMGFPMVENLSKTGKSVVVFDASPDALSKAEALKGVSVATSASDVAAQSKVLFTCLPNNDIVRQIYLGPGGVLEGGQPGLVSCDTSTVSPEITRKIHRELVVKDMHHMDTPMLGSLPQAISGDIFFIVAGDQSQLPPVSPLLDIMGKMHMHVGQSGTANQIKLIHNALGAVNSVAVAESLALCQQSEVDLKTFYEVVRNGGGMAYSTYFERRVQRIIDGEFSPAFSLELMNKDVNLASKLADSAGLNLPILQETLKAFGESMQEGWGKEDFSAVTHLLEKRTGRKFSD